MIPEVVLIVYDTDALAVRAKAGTEADLLELWEKIRPLACWFANRWQRAWRGRGGVTVEDLEQSAAVALLQAVQGYDPAAGSFTGYYSTIIVREFAEASGLRTPKQARDPLHDAASLDAPLSSEEPDGACLLDTLADPRDLVAEADDIIFRDQLAAAVRAAMKDLPSVEETVIRGRFFEALTLAQLSQRAGVSASMIRARERRAIKRLRRRQDLRAFAAEMNFYRGTDLASFRHTGESSTERHALRLVGLGYSAYQGGRPSRALPPVASARRL